MRTKWPCLEETIAVLVLILPFATSFRSRFWYNISLANEQLHVPGVGTRSISNTFIINQKSLSYCIVSVNSWYTYRAL